LLLVLEMMSAMLHGTLCDNVAGDGDDVSDDAQYELREVIAGSNVARNELCEVVVVLEMMS
jgi:hypothetical protein